MSKKPKKQPARHVARGSGLPAFMLERAADRPADLAPVGIGARMAAEGSGAAELFLYDDIGGWGIWAVDVAAELAPLGRLSKLDVYINSPGGNYDQAVAIMAVVGRAADVVSTHVDGAALSAASLIAQAGRERNISSGGLMMLHEASLRIEGNAAELRAGADFLDTLSKTAAAGYAGRSGRPVEEIAALMRGPDGEDGTWLTPEGAVDAQLADKVVPMVPASMAFEPGSVRGSPPGWAAALLVGEGDPRVPRQVAADAARRREELNRRVRVAEASLAV